MNALDAAIARARERLRPELLDDMRADVDRRFTRKDAPSLVGRAVRFIVDEGTPTGPRTVDGTVTVERVGPRGTELRIAYRSDAGRVLHRWRWLPSVELIGLGEQNEQNPTSTYEMETT